MLIERSSAGSIAVPWSASATSGGVQILPAMAGSLFLPASFTATSVTFEVEEDDGTWVQLFNAGSALSLNVTVAKRNVLPEALFAAAGRVRFVLSGSNTGNGRLYLIK